MNKTYNSKSSRKKKWINIQQQFHRCLSPCCLLLSLKIVWMKINKNWIYSISYWLLKNDRLPSRHWIYIYLYTHYTVHEWNEKKNLITNLLLFWFSPIYRILSINPPQGKEMKFKFSFNRNRDCQQKKVRNDIKSVLTVNDNKCCMAYTQNINYIIALKQCYYLWNDRIWRLLFMLTTWNDHSYEAIVWTVDVIAFSW